jgi:predicted DNA-binding transcriptional regulator YafY
VARRVEPLGRVGAERDWYLVGWCRLRGAVRVFRLDRITAVELTVERSPERPPPTIQDGCLPERSWQPAIVA